MIIDEFRPRKGIQIPSKFQLRLRARGEPGMEQANLAHAPLCNISNGPFVTNSSSLNFKTLLHSRFPILISEQGFTKLKVQVHK
jgi:hypothetical protein